MQFNTIDSILPKELVDIIDDYQFVNQPFVRPLNNLILRDTKNYNANISNAVTFKCPKTSQRFLYTLQRSISRNHVTRPKLHRSLLEEGVNGLRSNGNVLYIDRHVGDGAGMDVDYYRNHLFLGNGQVLDLCTGQQVMWLSEPCSTVDSSGYSGSSSIAVNPIRKLIADVDCKQTVTICDYNRSGIFHLNNSNYRCVCFDPNLDTMWTLDSHNKLCEYSLQNLKVPIRTLTIHEPFNKWCGYDSGINLTNFVFNYSEDNVQMFGVVKFVRMSHQNSAIFRFNFRTNASDIIMCHPWIRERSDTLPGLISPNCFWTNLSLGVQNLHLHDDGGLLVQTGQSLLLLQ